MVPIIRNGIPIGKFSCSVETRLRINVENIIAVGNFSPAKDYECMLKAYNILTNKTQIAGFACPMLTIVGDGPLRKKIESDLEFLDLTSIVKLVGLKDNVHELLSESDIFVMSSKWEGLSVALIEACASGLPIVATDAGSNREIVENGVNGIIVPINNPDALSEGLYKMITDHKFREACSLATKEISMRFSIEECASRHIQLYGEILSESNISKHEKRGIRGKA